MDSEGGKILHALLKDIVSPVFVLKMKIPDLAKSKTVPEKSQGRGREHFHN